MTNKKSVGNQKSRFVNLIRDTLGSLDQYSDNSKSLRLEDGSGCYSGDTSEVLYGCIVLQEACSTIPSSTMPPKSITRRGADSFYGTMAKCVEDVF